MLFDNFFIYKFYLYTTLVAIIDGQILKRTEVGVVQCSFQIS